jgi:hypothetical protein
MTPDGTTQLNDPAVEKDVDVVGTALGEIDGTALGVVVGLIVGELEGTTL